MKIKVKQTYGKVLTVTAFVDEGTSVEKANLELARIAQTTVKWDQLFIKPLCPPMFAETDHTLYHP